jgi:hypothetical protein
MDINCWKCFEPDPTLYYKKVKRLKDVYLHEHCNEIMKGFKSWAFLKTPFYYFSGSTLKRCSYPLDQTNMGFIYAVAEVSTSTPMFIRKVHYVGQSKQPIKRFVGEHQRVRGIKSARLLILECIPRRRYYMMATYLESEWIKKLSMFYDLSNVNLKKG